MSVLLYVIGILNTNDIFFDTFLLEIFALITVRPKADITSEWPLLLSLKVSCARFTSKFILNFSLIANHKSSLTKIRYLYIVSGENLYLNIALKLRI